MADKTATTAANGTYQIADVPAGSWAVVATVPSGTAAAPTVRQVVVGTNTQIGRRLHRLGATPAGAGYRSPSSPSPTPPPTAPCLSLTGDDAYTPVTLPFPVNLYGQTYNTGWVDTNGLVSLRRPR